MLNAFNWLHIIGVLCLWYIRHSCTTTSRLITCTAAGRKENDFDQIIKMPHLILAEIAKMSYACRWHCCSPDSSNRMRF